MFRQTYTAEEWRTLQFAPLWVCSLTAGIDDELDEREFGTLVKELSEWALYKEPLAQEVLHSVADDFVNITDLYKADSRDVVTGLKEVADLLERTVTREQAGNFARAMLTIGSNIAQASGGGLFGLGSKVSSEEETALALVKMTLRLQPSQAAVVQTS